MYQNDSQDYYLHILPNIEQSIDKHLEHFCKQRFADNIIIKSITSRNLSSNLFSDSYYYFTISACHICKQTLKNFWSLICHIYLGHSQFYEVYYKTHLNSLTSINEHHLIIYPNLKPLKEQLNSDFSVKRKNVTEQIFKIIEDRSYKNISSSHIKHVYKSRKIKDECKNRIYFHSVTGRIMNEDSDDEDYFIDENELFDDMKKGLETYTDINETEREFLYLWNKFMLKDGVSTRIKPEKVETLLKEFYLENKHKLDTLKECFILHLVNLYEYDKLKPEQIKNIIKLLN